MEKFEQIENTEVNPQKEASEEADVLMKDIEEINTIKNIDFLEKPKEKRLEHVTQKSVDYKKILSWETSQVTFSFDKDGDGKDNLDLYRMTTAGQVFWKEVWYLEENWVVYKRDWLEWEFFNNWKRLRIHTGTVVNIPELRDDKELNLIIKSINSDIDTFKNYKNKDLLRWLLERNIPVNPIYEIIEKDLKTKDVLKRKARTEDLLTEIWRLKEKINITTQIDIFIDAMETYIDWKTKVTGLKLSTYNGEILINWEYKDFKNKTWLEAFREVVTEVVKDFPKISEEKLISLINKENVQWDPEAKGPWKYNTAYGLGQMINDTWSDYGEWLDRNNPKDQLIASCKYLTAIMDRQNVSFEIAIAYYNTWENFLNISNSKFQEYLEHNAPIVNLIEWEKTIINYFIAAIAYYNDWISFQDAKIKLQNETSIV